MAGTIVNVDIILYFVADSCDSNVFELFRSVDNFSEVKREGGGLASSLLHTKRAEFIYLDASRLWFLDV